MEKGNPVTFILGNRPEHYHGGKGDEGCFPTCPVWDYDLKSYKIKFQIINWRMQEVKRCGDSQNGPKRMVALTGQLHSVSEVIKAMEG